MQNSFQFTIFVQLSEAIFMMEWKEGEDAFHLSKNMMQNQYDSFEMWNIMDIGSLYCWAKVGPFHLFLTISCAI